MNLNDLKAMVADDIVMDDTELDIESLKTPQLHNKYLNFFHDEKLIYVKQEEEYKKLYRLKWEYYTGKMDQDSLDKLEWEPFQLNILKVDIEKYLSSDDDLSLIRLRLSYTKEKVDYLESVIKIISNRQWNIRSAIDWRKFLNGV